jgi:hypothetical protein
MAEDVTIDAAPERDGNRYNPAVIEMKKSG